MTAVERRAVWILGACQCVYWGILYYGFSVLLAPLERSFGASRAAVAGAFTAGLVVMALAAPLVGGWIDRNRTPAVFRCGLALALAGIALLARAGSIATLYLAWILLGGAMAALLYEPAFGLVLRAFELPADRLRALAAVTVAGGLASTIFLPLLAFAVEQLGWRRAWGTTSIALLVAALALERLVFPHLEPRSRAAELTRPGPGEERAAPEARSAGLASLLALFGSTTFAGMAFSTLLIPLLVERGQSVTVAAGALGLLGAMQLPGRLWMLRGGGSGRSLVLAPLILQSAGLAAVAVGRSLPLVSAGIALFGLGAGLHTLARPWLVQTLAGERHAGRWNGRVARFQGFARASGPLVVAAAAGMRGSAAVFGALAVGLSLLLPLAWNLARGRD